MPVIRIPPDCRTRLPGCDRRATELDELLLARGKALEAAGYHQQVKVTPSSTLLFTLHNGARVPVHRRVNGNASPDFLIEGERIPEAELLSRIASSPQDFSANVLLRPVIQDYLLPTSLYRRFRRGRLLRPTGCRLRNAFGKGYSNCSAFLSNHC